MSSTYPVIYFCSVPTSCHCSCSHRAFLRSQALRPHPTNLVKWNQETRQLSFEGVTSVHGLAGLTCLLHNLCSTDSRVITRGKEEDWGRYWRELSSHNGQCLTSLAWPAWHKKMALRSATLHAIGRIRVPKVEAFFAVLCCTEGRHSRLQHVHKVPSQNDQQSGNQVSDFCDCLQALPYLAVEHTTACSLYHDSTVVNAECQTPGLP